MNLQAFRRHFKSTSSIEKISSLSLLLLCLCGALFSTSVHSIEHTFHDQTEICYLYESLEKPKVQATSVTLDETIDQDGQWGLLSSQIYCQSKGQGNKTRAPPKNKIL